MVCNEEFWIGRLIKKKGESKMDFFTEQDIIYYKRYFSLPSVIDEANKIVDAIKSADKLNNEEKMASAVLAFLKLQEHYRNKKI